MINFIVHAPSANDILNLNEYICSEDSNPCHCYGIGKVESAIHSAFYPGSAPFVHGGIAKIAGALCFYLVMSHAFMDGNKRTGAIAAVIFMNKHGWDLEYPFNEEQDTNALADIIEACASGRITKEQLIIWFENHKKVLED